ncbi:uncharacterized protein MELLADRAFT_87768 [Melampsora larici-populina 98AG31]|uniref:FAR1 domain-containing protein n=1 Tax=Melampsora larici-populina (strain 98AG31 / pathotype 3-4-7) TaxID=747676 RepID=F4SDZ5_MELLP|nr:uncharacterized protein MELLADRAFT_87768 [Melampsora larici-populina 98AG31]EGF97128.1 hypothetical protein MELLADRAFT_87768 [Melampsora larici-populina 98AG31]
MDNYVQAFGAHKYGYNIRKGNSTTGLICHYHCHRGGFPAAPKKESTRPTRSARIGCNFKLTARPNHAKKSWLLIHTHLGHNHLPNYNVKPRKRKEKPTAVTTPHPEQSQSTPSTIDEAAVSHEPLAPASKPSDHDQHPTDIPDLQANLVHFVARLQALSPNTQKYKIEQINHILKEEPLNCRPSEEHELDLSINQMFDQFLGAFSESDSADNSFIQIANDLIPKDATITSPEGTNEVIKEATTPHLVDNATKSQATEGLFRAQDTQIRAIRDIPTH